MKFFRTVLLLLLIGAVFLGGYGYGRRHGKSGHAESADKAGRRILYYVDPMHPAYKSDKPGIAPDCGMKLVPVYADGQQGDQPTDEILGDQEPQHTTDTSHKPGATPGGSQPTSAYGDDSANMPMGTIKVSPRKRQLIGVTYGTVEAESGVHTFRAVGKVGYDETRIARVHSRIDGWVDQVYVDFVGKKVAKGQPLLTIYSPELVATQQEYLLALRGRDILKESTLDDAVVQSESLVSATRKRLELWQLSDAQINEVARTGKPLTYVTLYSQISGYVTARNTFPKQRITPDTDLYTVADLSKVWIMADVFEYEAPMIKLNQQVRVNISYMPGRSFPARVDYIQPEVDPTTRTLKVRLEAQNPQLLLKPNMYVDVEFRVEVPRRLTVPTEAVLDSGLRKTAFVDRGDGFLEPREVETGQRVGDRIEIRKGLNAGERIVTSGNFLIDSESALQSALAGMSGHQHGGGIGGGQRQEAAGGEPSGGEHRSHSGVLQEQGHQGHQQ